MSDTDPWDDPRLPQAAADVGCVAAWLAHRYPGQGAVLAFAYGTHAPEGGTIARVDVHAPGEAFVLDRPLSRLATRAVWALGWPHPMGSRGLPVLAPDPGRLPEADRRAAVARVAAAWAAAPPELLAHPVRTVDEPSDADLGDLEAVAAWLEHRHPGRIVRVVVQHDPLAGLRLRLAAARDGQLPWEATHSEPRTFGAGRVDTADGLRNAELDAAAGQALVALGWRHAPQEPQAPWVRSWRPAVMREGFKAQAVARVDHALGEG